VVRVSWPGHPGLSKKRKDRGKDIVSHFLPYLFVVMSKYLKKFEYLKDSR